MVRPFSNLATSCPRCDAPRIPSPIAVELCLATISKWNRKWNRTSSSSSSFISFNRIQRVGARSYSMPARRSTEPEAARLRPCLYASDPTSLASPQPESTDFSRQLNAPTGRARSLFGYRGEAYLGHRDAGEHTHVLETKRNTVVREVWLPTIAGPCRPIPKSPHHRSRRPRRYPEPMISYPPYPSHGAGDLQGGTRG